MKTKTRDLSACLKRRLWIAGVCLAAFSFLSVSVVYAADDIQTIQQQKKGMTIKGKVLGTDGEPIIGASVLVKGSTTGVVTDLDGKEKKDRVLSKEEKQTVAYHEVGHALVTALKKDSEPVQKITIVPRTMGSLGYVMQVPEEEKYLQNKDELMARLVTLVAGRAAEEIVFGKVTTGAANDIEKATKIAKAMITQYGMSDRFGLMNLATVDDPYLNGNARLDCSDETAAQIDEEVKNMLKECYEEAKQLLIENRDVLDKIAHYLYDHETITGKEFMKIFREVKGIPEPVDTTGFTHSEKVAESVTFNEDGSYSSTLSGPAESDIWKGIGDASSDTASSGADNKDTAKSTINEENPDIFNNSNNE